MWALGAAVALAAALGSGCSGVPVAPTYSPAEVKSRCESRGGIWRPDVLAGGYCEYPSQL